MSSPGRILFLTQTASPFGGVENWLEYLVPGLRELGWDVTVGLVRGRQYHDPQRYLESHPYPDTLTVPALTGTREGRVRAVARAICQKQFEIVVPVNVGDMLEAVRRAKAAGVCLRVLYPLHGDMPSYLQDVAYYKGCLDYAVSTNRRGQMALQIVGGLAPERTAHVACGSPPALLPPDFEDSGRPLRLAYVGRLIHDQKRVRELPSVCSALDRRGVDYRLDIAGAGPDEPLLRRELAAQVARGRVIFHGLCSGDQLYRSVYPGLAALVLLSDWETGPIVAWEAMRHGATVVTTCYRGLTMERLLIHESNALVSPIGDVEALAANLERLALDPALALRLRRESFRTATERLSVEASVQGWHQAFLACLGASIAMDLPPEPPALPAGRLDRVFGIRWAETIRSLLGVGMRHNGSGGEWPHALHCDLSDHSEAARQLSRLKESDFLPAATGYDAEPAVLSVETNATRVGSSHDR